jgi:transposase
LQVKVLPWELSVNRSSYRGGKVGDLFMSLIHTCQLCGVNSFDYLIELQRHAQELAAQPAGWTPWNYRETLARAGVS